MELFGAKNNARTLFVRHKYGVLLQEKTFFNLSKKRLRFGLFSANFPYKNLIDKKYE